MDDTASLVRELDGATGSPSNHFLITLFKQLRKSKMRRPDIVVKYGRQVMATIYDEMEGLNIVEQYIIACLDMGEIKEADTNLAKLKAKFPCSNRVARLVGMSHEAKGEFDDALKVYEALLVDNPANVVAMKRVVAVYRAQNKQLEAVNTLHKLLELFPADLSAWLELSDIYLYRCDYQSAAHCLEDVVLLEPLNAHAHTRLADCYYTMQGFTSTLCARKHYAASLEQQAPNLNLRALYGLLAACRAMKEYYPNTQKMSCSGDLGDEVMSAAEVLLNDELGRWGQEQLQAVVDSGITSDNSTITTIAKSLGSI